jgi:hypothetical protein
VYSVLFRVSADNVQGADPNRSSGAKDGEGFQLTYYIVNGRNVVLMVSWRSLILFARTLAGAGEDCFRGLFYEVSLALVGVASPAYFQY